MLSDRYRMGSLIFKCYVVISVNYCSEQCKPSFYALTSIHSAFIGIIADLPLSFLPCTDIEWINSK